MTTIRLILRPDYARCSRATLRHIKPDLPRTRNRAMLWPMRTDPALMTAEELLAGYARRALSPVEALQAVMERVARRNSRINAFAVMEPRAALAAAESEARWVAGRPLGPLDGVPCTVKDLLDMVGLPTRRGSRTTDPAPVARDAPAVTGLRNAGAVIIGKTTTTEFGWKSPGDCPLHGITRNPHALDRTPGGSSSGAAAACAAGFAPLHVGTDGGGSIRIPAAWCGVVGLKPSFGRVPQWPLGAFGPVAVAGPIARTVRDTALMFSALARFDHRDPFCLPDDPRDWRDGIEGGVAGLRVAVLRRPGFDAPVDRSGIEAVEEAARLLQDAGAEVDEGDPGLPDTAALFGRIWSVALAGAVAATPPEKRALLDSGLLAVARHAEGVDAAAMLAAEALRAQAAHAMAVFHQRFDLMLCPVVPEPALPVGEQDDDPLNDLWRRWAPWTFAFNLTRQPAISVPMGKDEAGLPRSVQVAAALYQDALVLRAARAIETRIGVADAAA
jgi:aspartyl-tRNA(Asn)/glutamyl-tRNA(Gln) amidotransferase subunit A